MARAPLGMLCWSKHVVAQHYSEYGDLRLTQYNFWVVHKRFAYIVMVTASRLSVLNLAILFYKAVLLVIGCRSVGPTNGGAAGSQDVLTADSYYRELRCPTLGLNQLLIEGIGTLSLS